MQSIPYEYAAGLDIEEITIPENIEEVSPNAFQNCKLLSEVTITDGCQRINSYAFAGCDNLTEVTLPDTLNYIGYRVFEECWQLADIYYNGYKDDWYSIKKEFPVHNNISLDTMIHCLDGDTWI